MGLAFRVVRPWSLHLVTWSHSDHVVHLLPPWYAYRLTTHNTALIDLLYYGPYAWASQQSSNENIYMNLYIFLIIMIYSINIKNKKGCLNMGLFVYFHMQM